MIRRLITLTIAAAAFWGGMQFQEMTTPDGCRAADLPLTAVPA